MNALRRLAGASALVICTAGSVHAQESAAGNAVAEQLAQSSLRMIGSLVAVLALVAVCSWLLRRWRDRQAVANDSIEIVSGISLGSKERVVLLRVCDEQVLVGVSPSGMRSLHVVRQSEQPSSAAVDDASFESASFDKDGADAARPAAVPTPFSLTLGAAQ